MALSGGIDLILTQSISRFARNTVDTLQTARKLKAAGVEVIFEKENPFVFMDAIHYKVKEDHRYITKAVYVVLGITLDGRKDILGVWIGENESSKFWLNVLNELKSRGVMEVYLFCTDGLCGMMQAIEAVYPGSRLQRCIVHQIRASTRYVSYKDIKQVVADLKKIYTAVTLEEAEQNLRDFAERWRKQYPSCVRSWEENWEVLNTFFEYPLEIRKIIYTTNIIEGLNRQFRQITKNKPFPRYREAVFALFQKATGKQAQWQAGDGAIPPNPPPGPAG